MMPLGEQRIIEAVYPVAGLGDLPMMDFLRRSDGSVRPSRETVATGSLGDFASGS